MSIKELVDVVAQLRGPQGCPWDKAQTPESLTRYILEEAFELVEAIDSKDPQKIKEELGDYLFQVVLQAQIASESGKFDLQDVIAAVSKKMVHRHPHVFGNEHLTTPEQVSAKWDELKKSEKALLSEKASDKIMDEFRMPALLASLKIGERSEKWKFDWDNREQVYAKVEEEIAEVFEVIQKKESHERLEDEFGDFLFASVQWARHLNLDPEQALRKANSKFQKRFGTMIQDSGLSQSEFYALPLREKERLWQEAKKKLKA